MIQSYLKESLYERISLKRKSISSSGICSNSSGDVPSREGGGIPWVSLQNPSCTHHSLHWHPSKEMLKENGYIHRYGWVPSLFTWNYHNIVNCVSVQFSRSVVSDSLRPHELQHWDLPVHHHLPEMATHSSVHSDSRPSNWWCHPDISSSVVPFSSCPQSLPASESFPMSQHLAWGGQSTGVSALASFLPKNTHTPIQNVFGVKKKFFLMKRIFQKGHETIAQPGQPDVT